MLCKNRWMNCCAGLHNPGVPVGVLYAGVPAPLPGVGRLRLRGTPTHLQLWLSQGGTITILMLQQTKKPRSSPEGTVSFMAKKCSQFHETFSSMVQKHETGSSNFFSSNRNLILLGSDQTHAGQFRLWHWLSDALTIRARSYPQFLQEFIHRLD